MNNQSVADSQRIANTIIQQLGGNRFAVMTGTKNFVVIEYGVEMKLVRNQSKANWLEIKLNGLDLYDMKFLKVTGGKMNKKTWEYTPIKTVVVKEIKDVYNDMLEDIFTTETGLYTHL